MPKDVQQVIGNAGGPPEMGNTKIGPVCRVSVAVTKSYPDMGEDNGVTRWVKVAMFKPSVQKAMMAQIDKGTVVIAEGVIEKSEYQGKAQFSMKASRVGLGEYFLPSAEDKAAAAKRFGDTKAKVETEEELVAMTPPAGTTPIETRLLVLIADCLVMLAFDASPDGGRRALVLSKIVSALAAHAAPEEK